MDPRRLLIPAALALSLSACAALGRIGETSAPLAPPVPEALMVAAAAASTPPPIALAPRSPTERPYLEAASAAEAEPDPGTTVPTAHDAPPPGVPGEQTPDNPAPSTEPPLRGDPTLAAEAFDRMVGGVQVFARAPGRVYPVRTTPLRVTLLTLAPGETVVATAAGDTVRWQIGETHSGTGPARRAHVLVKPFERGLQTNLVITTSRGLYLVQLSSGPAEAFQPAVAWDETAPSTADAANPFPLAVPTPAAPPVPGPDLVGPVGPIDAGYRIAPRGRAPAWTPTAVLTDGVRTFLRFPDGLETAEAPALFALGSDGSLQTLAYRQQGGLWVVDRVLDRAELRLGDRRARIVRIERRRP
ncbi:TrbG/VirB9 family P-type conjugative transfer protein [Brevundimonas staleyi]|uniref:TrbG/VirB9 family P-type conjugative transfer protein n=1 Tax=Brevundimonas staleyi TaxID=74326 RepID=A0ABW0FUB4_9CAUL